MTEQCPCCLSSMFERTETGCAHCDGMWEQHVAKMVEERRPIKNDKKPKRMYGAVSDYNQALRIAS